MWVLALVLELVLLGLVSGLLLDSRHQELADLIASTKREMYLLRKSRAGKLEALFVLASVTGMRRGELLGLKWSDINFAEGVLYVRRALVEVKGAIMLSTREIEFCERPCPRLGTGMSECR